MSKAILSVSLLLFTGFCCLITPPAVAATYNVSVGDSGFDPAELTIEVGDTVVWENVDQTDFPHSTTSDLSFLDPDYWDGPLYSLGDTYANTFDGVGTFTYHDSSDIGTGTIIVNPTSVTPAITLGSPRTENGQFLFDVSGLTVGKTNIVQSSTNLISWTAIQTNIADAASMTFTNAMVLPCQCFRLLELP